MSSSLKIESKVLWVNKMHWDIRGVRTVILYSCGFSGGRYSSSSWLEILLIVSEVAATVIKVEWISVVLLAHLPSSSHLISL